MKIYLGKYKDNWISPYTIKEKFFFWKKDYDAFDKKPPAWLSRMCEVWFGIADKVNPRREYIHIDKYDVWNMDATLAQIILPMLKVLKEQKNGSGCVEDEDVPYGLRSFNAPVFNKDSGEWDSFLHLRFEWLLDELIWTFTALHPDIDYEDNYSHGKIDHLWLDCEDGNHQLHHGPKHTYSFDYEAYTEHCARVSNGLRLFGKYYRALWD